MYSSVRGSSGFEKIFSVGACSTRSPLSMNAVVSATRAACCMLCVTMTIVKRSLSSATRSSIFSVAIGSSAEARLVHQDHLGLDRDRARDAEPLLLAAGEPDARRGEAVLDLVPQAGAAQRPLDPVA